MSLSEQRLDIKSYARLHDLRIAHWFTEIESAASNARPVFRKVMEFLKDGSTAGLIVHKIDRSARNLADWSTLSTLIDTGADVRFVRDNLDPRSRGWSSQHLVDSSIQVVAEADADVHQTERRASPIDV